MLIKTAHKKDYISKSEKKIVKFMVENSLLSMEAGGIKAEILVYLKIDLIRVKFTVNNVETIIEVKIINQK